MGRGSNGVLWDNPKSCTLDPPPTPPKKFNQSVLNAQLQQLQQGYRLGQGDAANSTDEPVEDLGVGFPWLLKLCKGVQGIRSLKGIWYGAVRIRDSGCLIM